MHPLFIFILGILSTLLLAALGIFAYATYKVTEGRRNPDTVNETMKVGENIVVKLGNTDAIS